MLRLRLFDSGTDKDYTIELYQNFPVNLQYRFTDITQINKSVGSYSQTFRVPASDKNLDFFGSIIDPGAVGTGELINGKYRIKRKIRAILLYNTIPVMSGHVQLKSVIRQKKNFYDIELVFFGESVDLFNEIGNKLMSEMTLTALSTVVNRNNIIISWLQVGSTPLDGTLIYGVIDKGRNWGVAPLPSEFSASGSVDPSTVPLWGGTPSNNLLNQCDFTPFVQAKFLVNQILTDAGFTLESTFMSTNDFENIYVPLHAGGNNLGIVSDDIQDNSARVGLAANDTTTSTSFVVVDFIDTVTGGLDPGTNFDNTTHAYTSPVDQYIKVDMYFKGSNCQLQVLHKDSSGTLLETLTQVTNGSSVVNTVGNFNFNTVRNDLFVSTGDTITCEFKVSDTTVDSGVGKLIGSNSIQASDGCSIRIYADGATATGFTIDPALNMPELKQVDFLAGLQKMFNLVFIADKSNPRKLKVEPFKDFVASGTLKDWTNKIDFNKDLVIKPTTDLQKSKFRWKHSEGEDFVNSAIFTQLGRVYGEKEVLDPDNDFASGDLTIQSPFSPFIMSLVPNSQVAIHRAINTEGQGVKKPKMKLAYWNSLVTGMTGTYKIKNDDGSTSDLTTFPFFSSFNATVPEVEDNVLNFGRELPLIPHESKVLNTLYYKYWSGYVNELYSSEARILECFMFLTTEDISTFEFNDRIIIENQQYRILEITGFDATTESPCRVKLIKILSEFPDCEDIPTDVTSEGIITFNGSATDFGNQECCERYGFVFTPDKAGGGAAARCRAIGFIDVPQQTSSTG